MDGTLDVHQAEVNRTHIKFAFFTFALDFQICGQCALHVLIAMQLGFEGSHMLMLWHAVSSFLAVQLGSAVPYVLKGQQTI